MRKVIGLGAGGHSKVVIDVLRLIGSFELVGLLDPKRELWGTEVLGVPVLGDDTLLERLLDEGVQHVFIGLGGAANTAPRRQLYEKACRHDLQFVDAIHPVATIASSVEIGRGPTVLCGAIINAAAKIGDNVIINTAAVVEHDCIIGNHVHVSTGARLASAVRVDDGAHVGLGACIRQGIHIGRNAVVGAGATVVADVPDNVVVVGVPARILRKVNE